MQIILQVWVKLLYSLFFYPDGAYMMSNAEFKFYPVSHSWVAIHPEPKGIVQFIGGAFFGTFPTIFYRYFLRKIFEEGYTVIALPFRFSFRHWSIAISLLQEQGILADAITQIAKSLNYQAEIYQDKKKYYWLAHSLGCKYITLLEFLSNDWELILNKCSEKTCQGQIQRIKKYLNQIPAERRNIKGQPSLLVAPDISDTESAVPQPLTFIAHLLDRLGLGVLPTRKQTQFFIQESELFKLTGIISFDRDTIAGSETDKDKDQKIQENSDVLWFLQNLKKIIHQELPDTRTVQGRHCKHLEPIGNQIGEYVVDFNPLDKFIEPIKYRQLEGVALQFLHDLRQKEQLLSSEKQTVSVVLSQEVD
ncbi:MAG: hypothetical protein C6Y22_04895 [Hapalosiphonaceae cyanobacterium JJU2]|nr:MAG: hypothetical protein C6Y22_04895 [Hapalosiphonaceae cyanobacterium JJU2]